VDLICLRLLILLYILVFYFSFIFTAIIQITANNEFFFGHGYFIVFEEESVIVGRSDPQLGGVVMEARSALKKTLNSKLMKFV
jgi:hypothetical protein